MKAAAQRDTRGALAVLYAAHKRFGNRAFRVDRTGQNYPALKTAERVGWVWFQAPDRASITVDGRRALAPYGVEMDP